MHEKIIIPIGIDCSIAYALREKGLRAHAYPFDWNVTPVMSAIKLISNGFDGFLEEENLVFLQPVERMLFNEDGIDVKISDQIITPVVCRRYGILYPHDFSSRGKADLPDVKRKYERRIIRLKKAIRSSSKVCLLYNNTIPNLWQLEQYNMSETPFQETKKSELKHNFKALRKSYKNLKLVDFEELSRLIDPLWEIKREIKKLLKIVARGKNIQSIL